MGNLFSSDNDKKPLSNNESGIQSDIHRTISDFKNIIRTLNLDNHGYQREIIKKQSELIKFINMNNKVSADIIASQIVRYRKMIEKNNKMIERLNALTIKLQETRNAAELKGLIDQSRSFEFTQQNPLFRGGEYMEKLIKYEDKLLALN
jgi:hypothetical protein